MASMPAIITALPARFIERKSVRWHISNEYSGECHCDYCKNAFRDFLRQKFDGDISKLNRAYWTTFWSHTYDSFDQIDPPGPMTETGIHGLNLDWHRFVTHQTMDFIENEVAPIRQHSPNLQGLLTVLDAVGLELTVKERMGEDEQIDILRA